MFGPLGPLLYLQLFSHQFLQNNMCENLFVEKLYQMFHGCIKSVVHRLKKRPMTI